MRVFSNAPALPRRAVFRGAAAALAAASVPAAAIAGLTARQIWPGGDDTELLSSCQVFHERDQWIKDTDEELLRNAAPGPMSPKQRELEARFEAEAELQWWSFLLIIQAKAETLQGVAAQFEVLERYWYPRHSDSPKVDTAIAKMMANVRCLVAAQSAEV
jgi:hypothetical protein